MKYRQFFFFVLAKPVKVNTGRHKLSHSLFYPESFLQRKQVCTWQHIPNISKLNHVLFWEICCSIIRNWNYHPQVSSILKTKVEISPACFNPVMYDRGGTQKQDRWKNILYWAPAVVVEGLGGWWHGWAAGLVEAAMTEDFGPWLVSRGMTSGRQWWRRSW